MFSGRGQDIGVASDQGLYSRLAVLDKKASLNVRLAKLGTPDSYTIGTRGLPT